MRRFVNEQLILLPVDFRFESISLILVYFLKKISLLLTWFFRNRVKSFKRIFNPFRGCKCIEFFIAQNSSLFYLVLFFLFKEIFKVFFILLYFLMIIEELFKMFSCGVFFPKPEFCVFLFSNSIRLKRKVLFRLALMKIFKSIWIVKPLNKVLWAFDTLLLRSLVDLRSKCAFF